MIDQGLQIRFWRKVRKTDGCWLWTAGGNQYGYGLIREGRRGTKLLLAHRLSWLLAHDSLRDDLMVLHSCDNPGCVRPDHLFLGDHLANMQDCANKGRHRGMTGKRHPYDRKGFKLSRSQAEEIRGARGLQSAIAERFGVSQPMVSRIKRGQYWPIDAPQKGLIG